nr:hypothetical protein [uncultured Oscillibacter sp.]
MKTTPSLGGWRHFYQRSFSKMQVHFFFMQKSENIFLFLAILLLKMKVQRVNIASQPLAQTAAERSSRYDLEREPGECLL